MAPETSHRRGRAGEPGGGGAGAPGLRHLIVDECQDVNPAQERLIRRLTGPRVELCVNGDDDQAIYQWRGSDARNIVEFASRYPGAHVQDHSESA